MTKTPVTSNPSAAQAVPGAERSRANTQQAYEQIAEKHGTTTAEVKRAADEVGPNAVAVEAALRSRGGQVDRPAEADGRVSSKATGLGGKPV